MRRESRDLLEGYVELDCLTVGVGTLWVMRCAITTFAGLKERTECIMTVYLALGEDIVRSKTL